MSDHREQFISDENEELKRIRKKRLNRLRETKAKKGEMSIEPIYVTDSSFDDVVNKHSLALIDFWASWCGPCRALAPVMEELAGEYAGKIFVGKLNVDENPTTAERFQVFSIPTVVVLKSGKEVERIVGCVPKDYIEKAIRKHLG